MDRVIPGEHNTGIRKHIMIAGKIRTPAMAENVEKTKLDYGEESANEKCHVY
jgi:hypothetical protein